MQPGTRRCVIYLRRVHKIMSVTDTKCTHKDREREAEQTKRKKEKRKEDKISADCQGGACGPGEPLNLEALRKIPPKSSWACFFIFLSLMLASPALPSPSPLCTCRLSGKCLWSLRSRTSGSRAQEAPPSVRSFLTRQAGLCSFHIWRIPTQVGCQASVVVTCPSCRSSISMQEGGVNR